VVDTPEEAWASLVRRGLEATPPLPAPEAPPAEPPRRRSPARERMRAPGTDGGR